MRIILHIDMDAFFASVEQNDNPELRGLPVVVGSPSERGVIAASSYEAREYGVRSAMPGHTAKNLCSSLIFVRHRMERYREVSMQVFKIFYSVTDQVEALSIDEAFIDVSELTDDLKGGEEIARRIKDSIFEETGLKASAGVSYNKFLAKLASGLEKPDGLVILDKARSEGLLPGLQVDRLFGIGRVTADKMHRYGIHKASDIISAGEEFLVRNFGKAGIYYYDIARGVDDRKVEPGRIRKSVGAELTFEKDLTTAFQVIAELYKVEKALWQRIQKHGKRGRTLTLKMKYDDFTQHTKSRTYSNYIADFKDLHSKVSVLREETDFFGKRIRLMGISLSNLEDKSECTPGQLELW